MADYITKSFYATMNDGTKKQIKVRGKTEGEAQKKLDKKKWEYESGLLVLNEKTTLKKWYKEWLAIYKKPSVSEGTLKEIGYIVEKYFINKIGSLKLCDIRKTHILSCINEMEGMSNSYIHRARIYIKEIFEEAVDNDILIKNPAKKIKPPVGTCKKRRELTEDERTLFLQTIPKHHRGAFFALMLACGLRPQEVRALSWNNVDLKNATITVNNAVKSRTNKIGEPKSDAGKRTIPIPDWYIPILNNIPKTSLLVFPNTKGQPIDAQRYLKSWGSFMRQMDIDAGAKLYRNEIIVHAIDQNITPYYLRHTYATELAEKGVDMKTAQQLLGHSDIRITAEIYTHVSNKMLRQAKKKVNSN